MKRAGTRNMRFVLVGLKWWRHTTAKHWNTLPRDTRSMADSKNF